MTLKYILGAVLAVCLVGLPLEARPHHDKMEHSIEAMTKRLDLSSSQVTQIEGINERYKTLHKSVMASMKPLMEDVRELSKSDAPDYDKIRTLLERMAPHRVDMHINRMKHKHEIKSVLTPEQREKFEKKRDKKRDKKRKYKKQ